MENSPTVDRSPEAEDFNQWRAGLSYTQHLIMNELIDLNFFVKIAEFGVTNIDDDMFLNDSFLSKRKVDGLERAISCIERIIENSDFTLKKTARPYMSHIQLRLKLIKDVLKHVLIQDSNEVNHETNYRLNATAYDYCLSKIKEIKKDIIRPLNLSGLIFSESQGVNIDKLMSDIVSGG